MRSIRVCSSSKSLCPSVGTVVPYMYGKLACLVLFTNSPPRREFRCPLYRVSALWHNHNTHTLATYEENKENRIVTLNMIHLYSIWCLITQYLTLGGSTIIRLVSIGLKGSSSSICFDDSWVRMSGLSSRGTPAVLVGSSCWGSLNSLYSRESPDSCSESDSFGAQNVPRLVAAAFGVTIGLRCCGRSFSVPGVQCAFRKKWLGNGWMELVLESLATQRVSPSS